MLTATDCFVCFSLFLFFSIAFFEVVAVLKKRFYFWLQTSSRKGEISIYLFVVLESLSLGGDGQVTFQVTLTKKRLVCRTVNVFSFT